MLHQELSSIWPNATEELGLTSRLLQSYLCNGITSATMTKEYSPDICGLSVNRKLHDDRDEYSVLFGADLENDYDEHRRLGLSFKRFQAPSIALEPQAVPSHERSARAPFW